VKLLKSPFLDFFNSLSIYHQLTESLFLVEKTYRFGYRSKQIVSELPIPTYPKRSSIFKIEIDFSSDFFAILKVHMLNSSF
jgi:hypothetical protein